MNISNSDRAQVLVQALPYIGIPNAFSAMIMIANYDENASHDAYR